MSERYVAQAWRMTGYYPDSYAKHMSSISDGFDYDDTEHARHEAEFLADLAAHDARVAAEARAVALDVNTRYRCCSHCPDDPGYHADNPTDSHTTSCGTWRNPCTTGGDEPAANHTDGAS